MSRPKNINIEHYKYVKNIFQCFYVVTLTVIPNLHQNLYSKSPKLVHKLRFPMSSSSYLRCFYQEICQIPLRFSHCKCWLQVKSKTDAVDNDWCICDKILKPKSSFKLSYLKLQNQIVSSHCQYITLTSIVL